MLLENTLVKILAKGLPYTGQEYPLMAEREGAIISRPVIGRLITTE